MKRLTLRGTSLLAAALLFLGASAQVAANGDIGEHVNHLKDNLANYDKEVRWMIDQVDTIVDTYEAKGAKAAQSDKVVDLWEEVDFHAAIETNYVPVYASIWQGLFGVKESIDKGKPVAEVRDQQAFLEQSLWQGLGAVKLAAQFQQKGMLAKVKTTEGPASPTETIDQIKAKLDRVVAKFAEQLLEEATDIVHDTYLNRFEGIEGELIAQDADLVEDLEKDFNVTLPKAIQGKASVNEVRDIVIMMQGKLDRARVLLADAEKAKKSVF